MYASKASCKKGIASVRNVASKAKVEDQTTEGWEKVSNPKFEIYTDAAGETRFRLRAANGKEILASQGYASKEGCKKGIESVISNAAEAPMEEEK